MLWIGPIKSYPQNTCKSMIADQAAALPQHPNNYGTAGRVGSVGSKRVGSKSPEDASSRSLLFGLLSTQGSIVKDCTGRQQKTAK